VNRKQTRRKAHLEYMEVKKQARNKIYEAHVGACAAVIALGRNMEIWQYAGKFSVHPSPTLKNIIHDEFEVVYEGNSPPERGRMLRVVTQAMAQRWLKYKEGGGT